MLVTGAMLLAGCGRGSVEPPPTTATERRALEVIDLPAPVTEGGIPLTEALAQRRSQREFTGEALSPDALSQILWAAQGHTQPGARGRTAPSAGGTYPLEVYVISAEGVFHYLPEGHRLEVLGRDDRRAALSEAALGQAWVARAPVVVVIATVSARTEAVYGDRAGRYVLLEAGHAAQNVLLEAVALDMGAVPVGAFRDDEVAGIVGLTAGEVPVYLIPIGRVGDT